MISASTLIDAAKKAEAARHFAEFVLHPRGLRLMMHAKAKDGETCHYSELLRWDDFTESVLASRLVDQALDVGEKSLDRALVQRASQKPGTDADFDSRLATWSEHMKRFAAVHRDQPKGDILIELERLESWPKRMGQYADVLEPPATW